MKIFAVQGQSADGRAERAKGEEGPDCRLQKEKNHLKIKGDCHHVKC